MLKQVFLVLICCFAGLSARAQDILNIQASIGPSFGVGQFAADDMKNPGSGYADIGGIINLHVGLKPSKNFGVCFFGAMAMYPAKTGKIEAEINTANSLNLRASSTYYRFGMATGGLMFSGRVSEHFALDSRLTAGYMWAETPSIEMRENDIIYYKHYRTPGGGITACGSFGFRYIFKRIWYVCGTADFIFGYPEFNNAITETRVGGLSVTQQNSYHQFIGTINITGGIGISF